MQDEEESDLHPLPPKKAKHVAVEFTDVSGGMSYTVKVTSDRSNDPDAPKQQLARIVEKAEADANAAMELKKKEPLRTRVMQQMLLKRVQKMVEDYAVNILKDWKGEEIRS